MIISGFLPSSACVSAVLSCMSDHAYSSDAEFEPCRNSGASIWPTSSNAAFAGLRAESCRFGLCRQRCSRSAV
eukprot:10951331-Prorocentrum_lima.AAC.1